MILLQEAGNTVITPIDFEPGLYDIPDVKRDRGNQRSKRGGRKYKDIICAFDIETTTIQSRRLNFMYVWQFQFGSDLTVVGRTWQQLRDFLAQIREVAADGWIVCYVHNLSYEWQYLKSIMHVSDVFAVDSHKVIRFRDPDHHIEFRCSYFLTNSSLEYFLKSMRVDVLKLSGEAFNYDVIRYPWTELSTDELRYCVHDVCGLVRALAALMKSEGDTLCTVPMTATGMPRRDMKRVMRLYNRHKLDDMHAPYDIYLKLREAFRGGDTHANRFYTNKVLDDVISMDRSSSYPDVLCNCKFPMSGFKEEPPTFDRMSELVRGGKALLITCGFNDIHLKEALWGNPYISFDKCLRCFHPSIDNGRILSADRVVLTLTDIDLRIISDEYTFKGFDIISMYSADYGMLPDQLRSIIKIYYQRKTALKGSDDPDDAVEYALSKAKLNSLYGMMAQNIMKPEMIYDEELMQIIEKEEDPKEILKRNQRNSYLPYQWGVWCTAWARYRLYEGIELVGHEAFVYCDTDSVKYFNDPGIDWGSYNDRRKSDSERNGAMAEDRKGVYHYMGVYEFDGSYDGGFKTLGAKRYAYKDADGQLHITISGVSKAKGAEELGDLSEFAEGFIFRNSGKTSSTYVDVVPDPEVIDGYMIEYSSYILIDPKEYHLGLSDDYRNLLKNLE